MLSAVWPYVAWDLSAWEVYGLFFLLGSFVVATVSDVKHLSAQREFMDVWWAFAVAMLALQAWLVDFRPPGPLVVKWLLVIVFGVLCHRRVGVWLRLASADVAACVAAASLLSPGLVLAFFLLLKVVAWPAAMVLARGRSAYPFMPVVTIATLVVVGGAVLAGTV